MLKTLTRIALVVAGLLLLLLVAIMLLLQTPLASLFAENRLRTWVHPAIQVNGPARISILPRLGMDLQDITIPSQTAPYPPVSIKQLQWQVSWASLFEHHLAFEQFYMQGVELSRSSPQWESFVSDMQQSTVFDDDGVLGWIRPGPLTQGQWQFSIKQALIEDVAVRAPDAAADELPMATLGQLELKADLHWPATADSFARLGLRQLSINDAEQFGHTPALLEQIGIANDGAWDVLAMDSDWGLGDPLADGNTGQILVLRSFKATGTWGELVATSGTINLATGKLQIPVHTILTNAPKFRSRALEINVRQSNMRFELTGTLAEPGLRWLNQPSSNR